MSLNHRKPLSWCCTFHLDICNLLHSQCLHMGWKLKINVFPEKASMPNLKMRRRAFSVWSILEISGLPSQEEEEHVDRPLYLSLVGHPKISIIFEKYTRTYWGVLSDRLSLCSQSPLVFVCLSVCMCVLERLKEGVRSPGTEIAKGSGNCTQILFKNSTCS